MVGSQGVYEALKKLFVTDKDGHITIDEATSTTLARLQPWYQPNFDSVIADYTAVGVTPHADTTRWTYTVPTNRLAMMSSLFLGIIRATVPTTAARAEAYIGINSIDYPFDLFFYGALANDHVEQMIGQSHVYLAGDVLVGRTTDTSTGGTISYAVAAQFMEFDT